jgi:hypothetical protein
VVLATAHDTGRGSALSRSGEGIAALDNATRALYERVRAAPQNRRLWDALHPAEPMAQAIAADLRILLVPGILFRDYPETGADGALLRDIATKLQIPFETIPVDGTEGLDAAAAVINERLLAVPQGVRVLLFSLSKGSAEVRHALSRAEGPAAFRRVHAWVSVSGLPFGTPSVELVLRRPLSRALFGAWFWLKRWKLGRVRELLYHRPAAPFALPPHLRFIQIAAFPLQAQLRDRRSRRLQRKLASFGPNDGFAVLGELAALPGSFYPIWGADHYLHGVADLAPSLERLIEYLSS